MNTISQHLIRIFFTLLSAVLFMFSFPNFIIENGVVGLSSIALIPLFVSLLYCKTYKQALLQGLLFGLFSTLLTYFWLSRFQEYSIWTLGGVSLGYMGEYALVGLILYILIHIPQKYVSKNNSTPILFTYLRPICITIIWTAYEYLKSIGFLGFPWALLAHSVHNILPVIQITRIVGVWGISFILAFINAFLFECIYVFLLSKKHHKTVNVPSLDKSGHTHKYITIQFFLLTITITLVFVYGIISLSKSDERKIISEVPMLLIQQNIDSWTSNNTGGTLTLLEEIIQQSNDKINVLPQKPELLVWSETSLKIPYQPNFNSSWDDLYKNAPQSLTFEKFLSQNNIPLLSGTPNIDTENTSIAYNSAVLIKPNGDVIGTYAKHQLVPIAELIPFYSFAFVQYIGKFIGLYGTWAPGKSLKPLNLVRADGSDLKIGTPICFEDGFSYITRNMKKNGANMLIDLTNVSWSKSKTAQLQQFVASRFRSIETGIPMVRSTNSGVTSLIDPWGRIIKRIPMFETASLFINVPIYEDITTIYMFTGDMFVYLMLVLTAVILGVLIYIYTGKNSHSFSKNDILK